MPLYAGIVGLPNVGKSTLFNALTNANALAANYPFATKDPQVGVITVPDQRLTELAKIVNPQKVLPTTVEIVDIAGLIKGASKGEGLGNQFLANIREVDAIAHVVRCFDNDNVKRLEKLRKQSKTGKPADKKNVEIAEAVYKGLEQGKSARALDLDEDGKALVKEMMLLTGKPILYVCNVDENSVASGNAHTERFKEHVKDENAEVIFICAAIEEEIAKLEDYEEKMMFVEEMGLKEPGVNRVIFSCYQLLNLITYFTAGEKEVRAWTVRVGSTAPQAAGVIHTDFEKGFIRAEVIKYDDYVALGSENKVKEAGKLGVEGKGYIVQDGDIMHFLFNV